MTQAVGQELLAVGAPELIAVIQAAQTMITTISTGDAATVALRAGPAFQVFLGTIGLQAPILATAELSAAGALANTQLGGLITKLKALPAPQASAS